MAEEKPRKSLTITSSKTKNPFSRMKDEGYNKYMTGLSMRKSWSTDSLGLLSNSSHSGKLICVCAPTKHEGSIRCRFHRSSATSHSAAITQLHLPKPVLSSRHFDDQ